MVLVVCRVCFFALAALFLDDWLWGILGCLGFPSPCVFANSSITMVLTFLEIKLSICGVSIEGSDTRASTTSLVADVVFIFKSAFAAKSSASLSFRLLLYLLIRLVAMEGRRLKMNLTTREVRCRYLVVACFVVILTGVSLELILLEIWFLSSFISRPRKSNISPTGLGSRWDDMGVETAVVNVDVDSAWMATATDGWLVTEVDELFD